ncbi:MAG TPA: hypothetical protein VI704_01670, partial [Bacteroidota bacterium]|nr:hypothetical protein [Bacteroidota bacterium]
MKVFGRRLFLFFSSYTFHVAGTVFAAQLQVPATYATISAAITAANSGDTIVVAAGTYNDLGTV